MASHLLDLPAELVSTALSHAAPADVARALAACKVLAQLGRTGALWSELLQRYCGLSLARGVEARAALETLLTVEPVCIRFVGTFTDGGIDSPYRAAGEELPPDALSARELQYWVSSLFEPSPWLLYCSASGRADVTCAAALHGLHDTALMAATRARRSYMLERLSLIAQSEWQMSIDGFGGLGTASPETLDEAFYAATEIDVGMLLHGISGAAERAAHLERIRQLRAQIEARWRARRRAGDGALALTELSHGGRSCTADLEGERAARLAAGGAVAVVRRLTVRRPTSCSCPCSHGVVYGSARHLSAEQLLRCELPGAHELLGADGGWLLGGEDGVDGLGPVVRRTACAEGEVLELGGEPGGPCALFPLALFSFRALAQLEAEAEAAGGTFVEKGLLVAELARPRCTRALVVRLLRAEDRMARCHDDHAEQNVDMDFVGLHGHLLQAGGERCAEQRPSPP